ncbi:MAG: hypothetical protein PHH75_00420 [Candidatus Omnitrophica bacterium]|nr:hypothetical protein [Candidatus Omnitrophota bacterium]MDD5573630.1 hypothetical protein [Candidatus Omnitrophota bacterium]
MTKDALIAKLEEGIKIEESAIVVYTKHMGNTLFLSGFAPGSKEKVAEILRTLWEESRGHRKIFEQIIARVQKDEKNVY